MFSTACVKFNVYIYTMVICVCSSHKTRGGQTLHAPIHKKAVQGDQNSPVIGSGM